MTSEVGDDNTNYEWQCCNYEHIQLVTLDLVPCCNSDIMIFVGKLPIQNDLLCTVQDSYFAGQFD